MLFVRYALVMAMALVQQTPDKRELTASLQEAVAYAASFYNISFTAAVTWSGSGGSTASAASGRNDWTAPGSTMTTLSLIPGGSLTKPYTCAACMNLVDSGLLDLSRPVHQYIDPWLASQTPPQPSLREIWHGNLLIETVTARQLLGMRSGKQPTAQAHRSCMRVFARLQPPMPPRTLVH